MPNLNLSQMLQRIKDPSLRLLFQQIEEAVNTLGRGTAVDPVGKPSAPSPIQNVNVKVAGEMLHVSLQDNNPVRKGIQYFTEIDTDPSFPQPIVYHHGTSRTPPPFPLPTKTDGGTTQNWYARSYAQLPGSDPSPVTVFGGNQTPQAITMSGLTQLTLLPSAGSGTAQATGQQGGKGLGIVLNRRPLGPKRNLG